MKSYERGIFRRKITRDIQTLFEEIENINYRGKMKKLINIIKYIASGRGAFYSRTKHD